MSDVQPQCVFCGNTVDPIRAGVCRFVAGWVKRRPAGGAHGIEVRETMVPLEGGGFAFCCPICESDGQLRKRRPTLHAYVSFTGDTGEQQSLL